MRRWTWAAAWFGIAAATIALTGQTQIVPGNTAVPGGSSGHMQYNNGGAFAGEAGLSYNAASDTLGVVGSVIVGQTGTGTGTFKINGVTSGTVTFTSAAAAGTPTLVAPTTSGTLIYQSYGNLYYDGDSDNDGTLVVSTLTIATADTYVQFTALTEGAEAGDVDCEDTDDGCSVSVAGTYLVNVQISFNPQVATKDIRWAVFKEGTVVNNCKTARDAAATATGSASIACIVAAVANDTFTVRGMNATDDAEIDVAFLHLVVSRVGA